MKLYDSGWLSLKPKFPVEHGFASEPTSVRIFYRDLDDLQTGSVELDEEHYRINADEDYIYAHLGKMRVNKRKQIRIYSQYIPKNNEFPTLEMIKEIIENLEENLSDPNKERRKIAELLYNWKSSIEY